MSRAENHGPEPGEQGTLHSPLVHLAALLAVLAATLALAPAAGAAFGFKETEVTFIDAAGEAATRAGSHPFAMATRIEFNTKEDPGFGVIPEALVKDLLTDLPAGFAVDPRAVPRCSNADFLIRKAGMTACPDASALGLLEARTDGLPSGDTAPLYNLVPPPGVAAKFGASALGVTLVIEGGVRGEGVHNLFAAVANISQAEPVTGSTLTLWGDPGDPAHDPERGRCLSEAGSCGAEIERPLITLPRSCTGPLATAFAMNSWQDPGSWARGEAASTGMGGCAALPFAPTIAAKPTSDQAESPTGLDFSLEIDDEGLTSPDGTAHSDIKQAVVTLPEGVTANPSVAEGLAVCSPAGLKRETLSSEPGEGCPQAAKIGTVEVETPLLEGEILPGALFVADPYNNPFGTLLALYVVIRDHELGILVKLAGKVEADPRSGQLITTFGDPSAADPAFRALPQLPFSDFRLRFREGGRSPLISPPLCGSYETEALFTPWARPETTSTTTSTFEVRKGVGGGPCPSGTPFEPGFQAGTLNNNAKSFSPFYMRLTRRDGDQDMTRFSSLLPPGLLGKLAGVSRCPQAAIDAARAKSGRAELASPSCPPNSRIGRIEAGAGVGSQLTYVAGSAYLAAPYKGAPLSVAVITPAVAGPFDAGTVVVQVGLSLDRRTAQVRADGSASDPIPHILQGIPLKVRDLRVHVDRGRFILTPTSCDPSQVKAQLWGGGADPFSSADDAPVPLAARFQAANCLNLRFKPRLSFALKGGTGRGAHPALRAVLRARPRDANLKRTVVRLPRSAFLEQGHIRTICTRVQFAAERCPKGAIYGRVKAFTPLLDEPLRGPAYLRSSNHQLPDLVFDLHGIVEIESSARIDSIRGGIRASFAAIPDAPLSKVVVEMQGGKKGLIVNSRNLCAAKSRAKVRLDAHNGRRRTLRPLMRARCGKRR